MARLDGKEMGFVRSVLNSILADFPGSRVWLFGSRAKENARGGDIDFLIEINVPVRDAAGLKRKWARLFKEKMGEQKIDIVLKHPGAKPSSFYDLAKSEGEIIWSHPRPS